MKTKTTKSQKLAALIAIFSALIFDPTSPIGYILVILAAMLIFIFIADFNAASAPEPVDRESINIDIEIPEETAADAIRRNHKNND